MKTYCNGNKEKLCPGVITRETETVGWTLHPKELIISPLCGTLLPLLA